MSILQVQNLSKRFGGLVAVDEVSFEVAAGEILSVIGPNGAGKSTLFKLISAFLPLTAGQVLLQGQTISGLAPHRVAQLGVVRTFQETTIFKEMTALENVIIAHHLRSHASLPGFFFNSRQARADEAAFRDSAEEILDYLGLGAVKHELARSLPHGYLRALGIAIGLAAEPKIILLDEPFAGMNPEETDRSIEMVRGIRERGVTVLLVEHDMRAVMRISDRIVVTDFGKKIAKGNRRDIQNNDAVIEAYLGREDDEIGL